MMRIGVAVVTCCLLLGGCTLPESDTGDNGSDPAPTTVGLGEPASDGKFTFTVSGGQCGRAKIGTGPLAARAQGEFCIFAMTVENTGDEAQTMFADNQYLYVGAKRYSASSEAALALDKSGLLFEDINPGNEVDGVVVFDVPKGATPDRLELHDSAFSGGVTVDL